FPQSPPPNPGQNPWSAEQPNWHQPEGISWGRYFDVLKRHVPLIILIVSAGRLVGSYEARNVKPVYDPQATIWINGGRGPQPATPSSQQLLAQTSWVELLRSFGVVHAVVRRVHPTAYY